MSAGSFVTTALCLLLMLAAAVDIWKLRIPNLFPIAIILLFPLWIYDVGWTPTLAKRSHPARDLFRRRAALFAGLARRR